MRQFLKIRRVGNTECLLKNYVLAIKIRTRIFTYLPVKLRNKLKLDWHTRSRALTQPDTVE